MAERGVLVADSGTKRLGIQADPVQAWRSVGALGALLTVIGVGDFVLGWVPTNFGNPEWEFATVVSTFSGLPLATMGFAGMLGAGLALGRRWLVLLAAVPLLVLGVFVLAMYLVFLLDVPIAMRAVADQEVAGLGIKKAIAKTTLLALGFGGAYVVVPIWVLRGLRRERLSDA